MVVYVDVVMSFEDSELGAHSGDHKIHFGSNRMIQEPNVMKLAAMHASEIGSATPTRKIASRHHLKCTEVPHLSQRAGQNVQRRRLA